MVPAPPRGPMSGGIATRGLVRSFPGVEAVKGLDLDVREGEVYGFLGLNGAGKTTTLKMREQRRDSDVRQQQRVQDGPHGRGPQALPWRRRWRNAAPSRTRGTRAASTPGTLR
jgi:ATPase subunit of ABC transporter with duplicated ATPase domains